MLIRPGADPAQDGPRVRPAERGDPERLAADLRLADRREVAALGREPLAALREAVACSIEPLAVVSAHGDLIALFGVAPLPHAEGVGAPWMLATPALETVSRVFLRRCRAWIERIAEPFELLTNCVDARNAAHIRWLRWCGFVFLRRLRLGPEGRDFLEFARLGAGQPSISIPPHQRSDDMCDLTAISLAFGIAKSISGAAQQQQQYKAQKRAAEQERALIRRQTINKYDELALKRQGERAAAARRIEESKRKALRASESARTRGGEAGSAGLSLQGLLRDIGGQQARFAEDVRDANRFSEQNLEVAASGAELQNSLRLQNVREPVAPNFFGAGQEVFSGLSKLQRRLT